MSSFQPSNCFFGDVSFSTVSQLCSAVARFTTGCAGKPSAQVRTCTAKKRLETLRRASAFPAVDFRQLRMPHTHNEQDTPTIFVSSGTSKPASSPKNPYGKVQSTWQVLAIPLFGLTGFQPPHYHCRNRKSLTILKNSWRGDDLSSAQWDKRAWQSRAEIRENLFWICAGACLGIQDTP